MLDAYIFDGGRSPFGNRAGVLAGNRPDDLLADVIRAVVERSAFPLELFEDVIVGCGNQAGEDSRCVARHAGLLAGLPIEIGGTVLQRNCGSGLGAIIAAAHALTSGEGDLFVTGGVESMSRAPFVMGKAEAAFSRQVKVFDSTVGARFANSRLAAEFGNDNLAQTADNLAAEYQITREECDLFALASQQKYNEAKAFKFFDDEIVPIPAVAKRNEPATVVTDDEFPRPTTNMEALCKLKALNAGGVTTAGNASGINDGAAALIVGKLAIGEKTGRRPLARVVASAVVGVPPRIMGIGPVPAAKKAMERAGITLADVDVIEINEAFAAQVLACLKGLGLSFEDRRVNPNGGAIAVGHPLGASGARLTLTAARQLQRTGGRFALVALCVGVGQGIAAILERF